MPLEIIEVDTKNPEHSSALDKLRKQEHMESYPHDPYNDTRNEASDEEQDAPQPVLFDHFLLKLDEQFIGYAVFLRDNPDFPMHIFQADEGHFLLYMKEIHRQVRTTQLLHSLLMMWNQQYRVSRTGEWFLKSMIYPD